MKLNKVYTFGIAILFTILTEQVRAENWSQILSCEKGAAVLDVNTDDRQYLQIVFRGDDILGKLYNAGMISLQYGQREYILRGSHAELKQVSPTATEPISLGGIFYPWDFKRFFSDTGLGSSFEIEPRGNELIFKKLNVRSGYSCDFYDETDGICRGNAAYHKTYYFEREYVLHDCH
jgi:hypothetical protein